jgi:MSHA biogenesis protein MshP
MRTLRHRSQRGFLIIAGIFLIVVLAGLALYLTTVSTTSQAAAAADINSSRAYQAARAGAEWAIYRILNPDGVVSPGGSLEQQCLAGAVTRTFTFSAPSGSTLSAFTVSVRCESVDFVEGSANLRTFAIESTACNEAPCPNSGTASSVYVERKVSLTVTKQL